MTITRYLASALVGLSPFLSLLLSHRAQGQSERVQLSESLSFYAPFDRGIDAEYARGDAKLWNAPKLDARNNASIGLPNGGEVSHHRDVGRWGGSLRFSRSKGPIVFYKADKNFPTPSADWAASISFWLNTDPANDLMDGFCDPIQITSKSWDDAAIFVEFEKRPAGIPFRLGVYADKNVWNPTGRKFETIPAAERPLAAVENPPFSAGKWTHVTVVVSRFNTGMADGQSVLYLDGKRAGEISPRIQTFTWEPQQAAVMLGLNFIGLLDELAIFDKALSEQEIDSLYRLEKGLKDIVSRK